MVYGDTDLQDMWGIVSNTTNLKYLRKKVLDQEFKLCVCQKMSSEKIPAYQKPLKDI